MRIPFFTRRREMRQLRDLTLGSLVHSDIHVHEKLDGLLKLSRRRELMVAAAENLVEKLADRELAEGAANAFCVTELFPIVELLRTAGRHEAAEWWAGAHDDWADFMSDEDEPEDQEPAEPNYVAAATHPTYV